MAFIAWILGLFRPSLSRWRLQASRRKAHDAARQARQRFYPSLGVRKLEQRRVLNGDVAALAGDDLTTADAPQSDVIDHDVQLNAATFDAAGIDLNLTLDQTDTLDGQGMSSGIVSTEIAFTDLTSMLSADLDSGGIAQAAATEIVFVDSRVNDLQSLLDGARDGVEVVVLDADRNGLEQISEHLAGRHDLAAVHVVSHGSSGQLILGNAVINGDNLGSFSAELSAIGDSLSADGDLLFYGCDVGEGDRGASFLEAIATATGADVAASTDDTGAASLGGNWELEAAIGSIEAGVVFTTQTQADYGYLFATITVSTEDDVNDGDTSSIANLQANPGPDGVISLREAIIAANNTAGDDIIILPSGTYTLTIMGTLEDAALTGDLDILDNGSITIMGAGAATTIIDAGGLGDRVFDVHSGATLELQSATITGGTAPDSGATFADLSGGGIRNVGGTLTLIDSMLSLNTAEFAGGGIANFDSGNVTVTNSILSQNSANIIGGGIYNTGSGSSVIITDSTLSLNSTDVSNGGGIYNTDSGSVTVTDSTLSQNMAIASGGGIYNTGSGSSVTVAGSTLSENSADFDGGGILNQASGSVTVINSTLSQNLANTSGGGIFNQNPGSVVIITNSTLTGNRADADGNGSGNGGGILNSTGTATLDNTIVAGNFRGTATPTPDDISSVISSPVTGSFNLIGDPNTAGGLVHGDNGNIVGQDDGTGGRALIDINTVLDTNLTGNGGPTLTHALVTGSLAIDAGSNARALDENGDPLSFDQRGAGFPRISNGTVDIGAFESMPDPAPVGGVIVVSRFDDVINPIDGVVSLREAIIFANNDPANFEIQLDAGTYWLTIGGQSEDAAAAGDLDILNNGSITIMGAGAGQTIIDAGGDGGSIPALGDRIFDVQSGATLELESITLTGGSTPTSGSFDDRSGGGIRNLAGTVTVINSTLSANQASESGGGIHNNGSAASVTVINSTLSENTAGAGGGGIRNSDSAELTISNSTLSQNSANFGGGIHNTNSSSMTITNSTVSQNSATGPGGGILNEGSLLEINNSTITGNRADANGSGFGEGGGLRNNFGTATLHNTIVAGNVRGALGSDGAYDINVIGVGVAGSFNLIGDPGTAGGLTHGVDGNIVGDGAGNLLPIGDILDTTLADNGGPTLTHALVPGSPAINAGDPDFDPNDFVPPLLFDQRGPGFDRISGTAIDIGAFEIQPDPPPVGGVIVVTTFDDVIDPLDGVVSLREAIIFANNDPDDFEIQLAAGTYWLTIGGQFEDAAATGDLDILDNGSVTIIGAGAGQTIINAGGDGMSIPALGDRVFHVLSSAALNVEGVTVTGGTATGSFPNNNGGGFFVDGGTFVVTNSTLSANSANNGGGIYNTTSSSVTLINSTLSANSANIGGGIFNTSSGSSVTLTNSTLSANTANTAGGGIFNQVGSVSLTDSTLSSNSANLGGGIFNQVSGSSVILTNSTLSANSANNGGGIYNTTSSSVTLINSTLSGNTASNFGGGIFNTSSGSSVTLTNSTLTGNRADANDSGTGIGGGINIVDGTVTLDNTIVAGNFNGTGTDADDTNGVVAVGSSFNLIGDAATSGGLMNGTDGNIVGNGGTGTLDINTVLDTTLADNGGPTLTHALLFGSPAVNAGSNALAVDDNGDPLDFDQRGDGFPRISNGTVDIGAFELQSFADPVVDAGGDAGDGMADTFVVSLDGADVVVTVNGAEVFRQAQADTDSLTLDGSDDDDSFIVDFSGGVFNLTIFVNGEGQQAGGDSLTITGGPGFNTITHTFDNANDGSLDLDGSVIIYTGLEPITDNMDAVNRVFIYSGVSETITLDTQTEIVTGDLELMAGLSPADASTTFAELTNVTGDPFIDGDQIEITGTDAAGAAVNAAFTVTDVNVTTLGDLLSAIGTAFAGGVGATATIDGNGRIVLETDAPVFVTDLALNLASDAGNGGNTDAAPLGAFAVSQHGGNVIDSTAGELVVFDNPTGSLTIDAGGGDDTITITSLLAGFGASLTINGGTGDDTVNLNASITFAADNSLDVDLQNDDANPGVDVIVVGMDANLSFSGTGGARLTASQNILMNPGSSITVVDGNVTLEANQQMTATTGSQFVGIDVNGATIESTGSGTIELTGRGGDGFSNNHGVRVQAGGEVIGGDTGNAVTITGTGGASTGVSNHGVFVEASQITSSGGDIEVVGTAGGGADSRGILISNNGQIVAAGTQTVTLTADSMDLQSATSVDAGMTTVILRTLTPGTAINLGAGANGFAGLALDDLELNRIEAANVNVGTSATTGTINFVGDFTADAEFATNTFRMQTTTDVIFSLLAEVDLTASMTGGIDVLAGRSISMSPGSSITTLDGAVDLSANAAGTTAGDFTGITLNNAAITTGMAGTVSGGAISLTGQGGTTGALSHRGILIQNMSTISSLGDGTGGTITLVGIGGTGTAGFNHGVDIRDGGTAVTSNEGTISITGQGGSGGEQNDGIAILDGAVISSVGTGMDAAQIMLDGTGGVGERLQVGVLLSGAGTLIASEEGNILIDGTGGTDDGPDDGTIDFGARGVLIQQMAAVRSTAMGGNAADIFITGTGGSGIADSHGVDVRDAGTEITTIDGNIELVGVGGDGSRPAGFGPVTEPGAQNVGVLIFTGALVEATGSGQIRLDGTGGESTDNTGAGADSNVGVAVFGASTVRSTDGDIEIDGTGGSGVGDNNIGVLVFAAGIVEAVGDGGITIDGTGGTGADDTHGVAIVGLGSRVTSAGSPIQITGTAGTGTGDTAGVFIVDAGLVEGAGATDITVTAINGVTAFNGDVRMEGTGTIASEEGNITIDADNDVLLAIVDADSNNAGTAGTVLITADANGTGAGGIFDNSTAAAPNITAAMAALRAATGIGTDADDINTASPTGGTLTLAAVTDSGDINVRNVGSLTIGMVDMLAGVTILDNAMLNPGNDNITILAASPMTIDSDVVNNAGGDIVVAAEGNANTMPGEFDAADDDLQINANITAIGGDGNIRLFAGGDILQTTGAISAAGAGTILLSAGEDYNGGMNQNGNAAADVVMAEAASIMSDTGMVTLRATHNVTLGSIVTNVTLGTVVITADFDGVGGGLMNDMGAIIDANPLDDSTANITANTAFLSAGSGVGSGTTAGINADIDTAVTNFMLVDGGMGPVNIHNVLDGGPVIVNTLTTIDNTITFTQQEATAGNGADVQFNGSVTSNDAGLGNGDIRLIADNGLTVTGTGSVSSLGGAGGTLSIGGGAVINGSIMVGAGDVTIQGGRLDTIIAASLTGSGDVGITALRDVIIRDTVTTTAGSITIMADTDGIANMDGFGNAQGGVLIEAAGAVSGPENVTIIGSDLLNLGFDAATVESVRIDADAGNEQVLAGGPITIQSSLSAPMDADIIINGRVESISGSIDPSTAPIRVTANQNVIFNNAAMNDGSLNTPGLVIVTATGGAIIDAEPGVEDALITAAQAALRALTGIGADADDINTATDAGALTLTLAAVTDSGDINIRNVGSLTIGTVDMLAGVTILDTLNDNSGEDNITLIAASPLTVDAPIINMDGGDVVLTAMIAGDVTINADVQVTDVAMMGDDGQIVVTAEAGNIIHNNGTVSTVGGDNTSTSGRIRYDAGGSAAAGDGGFVSVGDGNTLNAAAQIITVNGNIDIDGDSAATNNNTGVTVADANGDALIETSAGNITINGTGGGTMPGIRGVDINGGSIVRSTGMGAGVGTITITGTGGDGNLFNDGVRIDGMGTQVASVDGDVTIVGTGGVAGLFNQGVFINDQARVNITGSADVIINGTRGNVFSQGVISDNSFIGGGTGFIILDANTGELVISDSTVSTTAQDGTTRRILLSADSIRLDGSMVQAISLGTGQGEIVAAPDSGDTVNVNLGAGANGFAGAFNLDDAELNQLEARIVRIGSAEIGTDGNTPELMNQNGDSVIGGTLAQPFAAGTSTTITVVGAFTAESGFASDLFQLRTSGAGGTRTVNINGNVDLATNNPGRHFEAYAGLDVNQMGATVMTGTADGQDDTAIVNLNVRDGDVHYFAERSVNITAVSRIFTEDGEITLRGNQQAALTAGTFDGVTIDNSVITTGMNTAGATAAPAVGGDILIQGRGGTTGGDGVRIQNGATVNSLLAGMNAGTITIDGNSGAGIDDNDGVRIVGAGTQINSVDGDITITGDASAATGSGNEGINVFGGSRITSTGTGDNAAAIFLDGTGGDGVNRSIGVDITDDGTVVSTVDGDVSITGMGGDATGFDSIGVVVFGGAVVESTGSGAVLLDGTGGTGTFDNSGVVIEGDGLFESIVRAHNGSVTILGEGGTGTNPVDSGNYGIEIVGPARVESTGTATITLDGIGGTGADEAAGILLDEEALIRSMTGAVVLVGRGGSGPDGAYDGIQIFNDSMVQSTGTATIALTGIGGDSPLGDNLGIALENGGRIVSLNGNVSLTGQGGSGAPGNNIGIGIESGAFIESTGAATITLDGTAGTGADDNIGIVLADGGRITSLAGGHISLTGQGGLLATGEDNDGIDLFEGAVVESTGMGAGAAMITLVGTGGNGGGGITIRDAGTRISSVNGAIDLTGFGGEGFDVGGIALTDGARILSTGGATITLFGTGGVGAGENTGIVIEEPGSLISSVQGAIWLRGIGGSGSGGEYVGVFIGEEAAVESTGTATITIDGTGGDGTDFNAGVVIAESATVTSVDGNIEITGRGGNGSGEGNVGVVLFDNAVVSSTGVGANAATIAIEGTGGAGTDLNIGVLIDFGGRVESTTGNITITGFGSGTGQGFVNDGVLINRGSLVESLGTARITITGTGGTGSEDVVGVSVEQGSMVQSVDGNIVLNGESIAAAGGNHSGVNIEESVVRGTGSANVTLNGQASSTDGGDETVGVNIDGPGAVVSAFGGNVLINGQTLSAGANNAGVALTNGAQVLGTGAGNLTVNGIDRNDAGADVGVLIDGTSLVQANTGNVRVNAGGVNNVGGNLQMVSGARVISDGGNVVLTSTNDVLLSIANAPTGTPAGTPAGTVTVIADSGGAIALPAFLGGPVTIDDNGAGAIIDNLAGEGAGNQNVTAAAASFRAGSGIGSADDIDIAVATVAALNTTANNISFAGSNGGALLTIGTVSGLAGITNNAPGGNITVVNNGPLTVAAPGVTNNNGGNIALRAAGAGDLTVSGPVRVNDAAGNVTLTGAGGVAINNSVAGPDVSTVGAGSLVQITAQANDVRVNDGAAIRATGAGSTITIDAAQNATLGTGAQVRGVGRVDITAEANDVNLGNTSLVETTGPGSIIVINAAQSTTLGSNAQVRGVGRVDINAAANDVNLGTGSLVETTGPGSIITINAGQSTTLGTSAQVRGVGRVDINAAANDVNLGTGSLVETTGPGSIITINAGQSTTLGSNAQVRGVGRVDINAAANDVNLGTGALVETTGPGSIITINAGQSATLGTSAQVRGVGRVDITATANDVNLGNSSLVQTTGAGNTVNIDAGNDVNLGDAARILSQTDINVTAGNDVAFGPNVTIRTTGAGGVIDIDAVNGDVTGDFRNLDSTATIQTPDGIARRGVPFIDLPSINVPQIDIFGRTSLTVNVGVPGETNLVVTIDWGDGTEPQVGRANDPTDQRSTIYIVDAGTHTFFHLYFANPSPNQADPIPIAFTLEHVASINIDAVAARVDLTIDGADAIAETPGTGFGATVFELTSNAPALSFPESFTSIAFDNLSETSTQEVDAASVVLTASETTVAEDEQLVLRLILPSGEEMDFNLPDDILEGENTKLLWMRLPDGRYRIVLIRKDGSERSVLEVDVRAGRPVIRTEAPAAVQGPADGPDLQPNQQNRGGDNGDSDEAAPDGGEEPSDEMSRLEGESLPRDDEAIDETAAIGLGSVEQASPLASSSQTTDDTSEDACATGEEARRRPAVSAATLVGSAIAYRSLRRGSSAHGSWEDRVEQALASSESRPFGRAARLRRQLLR